MRRATVFVTVLVILLALAWFAYTGLAPGGSSAAPAATSSLACSVKGSCDGGEVEVFRMSATANAHAGAAGSPTYTNLVCCGGVAGLGTNCSGAYDTVLRLSAADNAHVASDGSYPTAVCLSVDAGTVDCTYDASCADDYACLATISGSTNAHVADCDDVADYATKVCCYAGPAIAPPVGGIAQLPDVSDSPARNYIPLAGLAALAALLALSAGAWYARRRWLG